MEIDHGLNPKIKISIDGDCNLNQAESWKWFNKFHEATSRSRLLSLVESENPQLLCYSFASLVKKKDSSCFRILSNNLSNQYTMSSDSCVINLFSVRDVLLTQFYEHIDYFSYIQKDQIDSTLLFSNFYGNDFSNSYDPTLQANAVADITDKPSYYNRIEKLAIEGKIKTAIIPLAKYQKQKDISIILNASDSYFDKQIKLRAISYFPDTAFYAYLKNTYTELLLDKNADEILLSPLYKCLSNYESSETTSLFLESLELNKFEYKIALYDAILEKPYFKSVLDQIHFNE
jgi:hypothetical protein